VLPVQGINVYDILRRDTLVLTKAASSADGAIQMIALAHYDVIRSPVITEKSTARRSTTRSSSRSRRRDQARDQGGGRGAVQGQGEGGEHARPQGQASGSAAVRAQRRRQARHRDPGEGQIDRRDDGL
jgi:ribosomal protein L19E